MPMLDYEAVAVSTFVLNHLPFFVAGAFSVLVVILKWLLK